MMPAHRTEKVPGPLPDPAGRPINAAVPVSTHSPLIAHWLHDSGSLKYKPEMNGKISSISLHVCPVIIRHLDDLLLPGQGHQLSLGYYSQALAIIRVASTASPLTFWQKGQPDPERELGMEGFSFFFPLFIYWRHNFGQTLKTLCALYSSPFRWSCLSELGQGPLG